MTKRITTVTSRKGLMQTFRGRFRSRFGTSPRKVSSASTRTNISVRETVPTDFRQRGETVPRQGSGRGVW